jgi:hypothetical protein
MSGTTTVEGYPYPGESDFADVQDAFRLATAIDADLRANQKPFRDFMGRPSFIGRQSATGSGFLSGSQGFNVGVVEWDNTAGLALGLSGWAQPFASPPSWWLFGATVLVNIVSGTPVVGDMNMGQFDIVTVDPVTGLGSTSTFSQLNDYTNTNGEWINFFAMAPVYHGSASCSLVLNGSTSKAIQTGSRFWGMQLGPVT